MLYHISRYEAIASYMKIYRTLPTWLTMLLVKPAWEIVERIKAVCCVWSPGISHCRRPHFRNHSGLPSSGAVNFSRLAFILFLYLRGKTGKGCSHRGAQHPEQSSHRTRSRPSTRSFSSFHIIFFFCLFSYLDSYASIYGVRLYYTYTDRIIPYNFYYYRTQFGSFIFCYCCYCCRSRCLPNVQIGGIFQNGRVKIILNKKKREKEWRKNTVRYCPGHKAHFRLWGKMEYGTTTMMTTTISLMKKRTDLTTSGTVLKKKIRRWNKVVL